MTGLVYLLLGDSKLLLYFSESRTMSWNWPLSRRFTVNVKIIFEGCSDDSQDRTR